MATSSARRFSYAPEDPTLPRPWKGLVDGNTGYLYFWNTETNVTQYERPCCEVPAGGGNGGGVEKKDGGGSNTDTNYQIHGGAGSNSHAQPSSFVSHSSSDPRGHLSAESYRRQHEITVLGGDVPAPFMTFDVTGFPTEVLTESDGGQIHALHSDPPIAHASCSTGELISYTRIVWLTFWGLAVCWAAPFTVNQLLGGSSRLYLAGMAAILFSLPYGLTNEPEGFLAPTPIQAQSWPIAMRGRDIVAVAKTGSGKTLGFLFPGFMHVGRLRNNPKIGPTVLVLSPTRELATQILVEAVKFGKSSRIPCTCLYGGASKGPQLRDIERGVDVVVATPGRLNDILEMRRISLHQVSYLVLDEADRMLDMGFEPQIRKIVKEIPSQRQTLMFTATWPKAVRKIASDLLTNPVQVNIGNINELVANKAITQHVEVISSNEKRRRLEQILRSQEPGSKIIIFCSTKRMCDLLAQGLAIKVGAAAIHGDKSQEERDRVLSQFRTGRSPVLVATDVAARGLDVKDIRVVVNYDFPTGVEDYVHRIGRTGRGGATGDSYTFFCDQDAKYAAELVKVLEGANQQVPSELKDMASRGGGGYGRFSRWGSGNGNGSRSYGDRSDSGYGRGQYSGPSYSRYEGGGGYQQGNSDRYDGGYNSSYSQGPRSAWANDDGSDRAGQSNGSVPNVNLNSDRSTPGERSRSRSPAFGRADLEPMACRWSP